MLKSSNVPQLCGPKKSNLAGSRNDIKISKFLSLILRHNPGKIRLKLDKNGWANIEELIENANQSGMRLNKPLIDQVVRNSDKQRFVISDDGASIRANQGHSIKVDLQLRPTDPPDELFHGTATRFLDSIFEQGLVKGKRQYVHLSADRETAVKVGARHGTPVVLSLDVDAMKRSECTFYLAQNGVWLTDFVAPQYLRQQAH